MPWKVHQSLHQTNQQIKHLAFNIDHALYTLEPTTYIGIKPQYMAYSKIVINTHILSYVAH